MSNKKYEKQLNDFRKQLNELEQKGHDTYDKTLITLSGGALGISFIFVKDIIKNINQDSIIFAFISWTSWGVSLMSCLGALFFSIKALRYIIKKLDEGKLNYDNPGGAYSRIVNFLNLSGFIFFLVGTSFFIYFAFKSIGN